MTYPSPQPLLEDFRNARTISELNFAYSKHKKLIKKWTDNLEEYELEYKDAQKTYKYYKKRLVEKCK